MSDIDKVKQDEEIKNYDGEDKVISSLEMREALAKNRGNILAFSAGLPKLDKLIDGFEGGELITISGKTGAGKTLLAQTLTSNFSKVRTYSLWFSYEMTAWQFIDRFPHLPLFYMPSLLKEIALTWIERKVYEARVKFGIKVVFIDHLHFLIDLAMKQNPSLQIGQIVRSLKRIALRQNIAIFLLCHTEKIKVPIPTIDDIRDSSLIPAESDIVLIIYRDEESDISGLSVEKSRRTGAWKKRIKLTKENGLLYETVKEEVDVSRPIRPTSYSRKRVFDKRREY